MSAVSQPKTMAVPHSVHTHSGQSSCPSRQGGCSTTRSARQPGQCLISMTSRWRGVPTKRARHAGHGTIPRMRGLETSAFLRACRGEPVPHTPVWFMRQAGRSLPEYRAARGDLGMLESCLRPEVVVEITMQPVRRYGVDAAILFSDIVLPLKAAGVDLDIKPGVGPVVAAPVRSGADVAALPELHEDAVAPVAEAVQKLVAELDGT